MPLDGVLQLDDVEQDLVHESFTVDTRDHEDHSFCGVMFNVECSTQLPAEYIEVQSLSVRGQLGPMTVWYTPDDFQGKQECEDAWEKVYEGTHEPSQNTYTELRLPTPLRLRPGQRCGLYVHSALPGDEGIVYDNQRKAVRQPRIHVHNKPASPSYHSGALAPHALQDLFRLPFFLTPSLSPPARGMRRARVDNPRNHPTTELSRHACTHTHTHTYTHTHTHTLQTTSTY